MIQDRAAKIRDEKERCSYLENVTVNMKIVSAYAGREYPGGEHGRRQRANDE